MRYEPYLFKSYLFSLSESHCIARSHHSVCNRTLHSGSKTFRGSSYTIGVHVRLVHLPVMRMIDTTEASHHWMRDRITDRGAREISDICAPESYRYWRLNLEPTSFFCKYFIIRNNIRIVDVTNCRLHLPRPAGGSIALVWNLEDDHGRDSGMESLHCRLRFDALTLGRTSRVLRQKHLSQITN